MEVGAAAQPLLNGCMKGMAVESTVPILVAGTVPTAAAKTTSPKVSSEPHSRPLGCERETAGPPLAQGLMKWLCQLRWCPFPLNYQNLWEPSMGRSWQPAMPQHSLVFQGWGSGGETWLAAVLWP